VDLALTLARRAHGSRVLLETAQSLGTVLGVRPYWRRALLAAVARLDVPVLIVWGTRDRVLPAPHREAISRALPRARVHAFAGAGHMPQIERAQAFHDLVEAFWARLEAGSPAREEAPAR
jgi:pimeloyl-ACP methyl ester carboxylesterase